MCLTNISSLWLKRCLVNSLSPPLFPPKIRWVFAPRFRLPFQDGVGVGVGVEPCLGTADEVEDGGVGCGGGELRATVTLLDPRDGVAAVGVDRQLGLPRLGAEGQGVDDGQKLADVVRALRHRADVEELAAAGYMHAAILHVARVAAARRIDGQALRDAGPDGLRHGGPGTSRRAAEVFVGRLGEGAFGLFARGERLVLSAFKTLGAAEAVRPIVVDAPLDALPYDVVFTLS